MRINYDMDRSTFHKILLLKKQCESYLLLAKISPNSKYYHSRAVKTLEVAKKVYSDWQENSTQTMLMVA